ncbi:MAG: TetR/AcrR family transcriptional regulator [Bacteroidota bacterium]
MREKIVEQASELFLNYGFKSVTMDDLAHKMAISKKTIYTHFKNKTQLVEAATLYTFCHVSDGIDTIIALDKNPIEELYEIKRFVMQKLKDEKASPSYQLQKYYPKIHNSLKDKQFEVMEGCIVNNIERGMAQGIYRTNLNVEFVSRIYFAGAYSIKDEVLFPNTLFSRAALFDHYLEYHLRGIVTPKGRQILNTIINSNQQ